MAQQAASAVGLDELGIDAHSGTNVAAHRPTTIVAG